MGRAQDKKSTMSALEKEVIVLRAQNERLAGERWLLDDQGLEAMEEMAHIMSSELGYWRIGIALDGNYWARWKWTRGDYAGGYVIGGHNTLPQAILTCITEVMKVKRGVRSPITDKGYRK